MPTIATARLLRKRMSPPEARMWVALRALRARGFHFRRQHPMRGWYVDFICLSRRLIVEVDGQTHSADDDLRRDAVLAADGFRTLRYDNAAVRDDLDLVVAQIVEALEAVAPTRPLRGHPPRGGEGED